jgi:hypothetical protein
MMQKIIKLLWDACMYSAVATVLLLAIVAAHVWMTYGFDQEKSFRLLAILYNVDIVEMEVQKREADLKAQAEDAAFDDVLQARVLRTLDQSLREQAIDEGLADLRLLQRDLMEERRRYDLLKRSFDAELEKLQNVATQNAIVEVQLTLETIKPKQAKDHVVRMLPDDFVKGDFAEMSSQQRKAVIDVVAIMKAMPLDKRKKILAEFKTEEEAEMLAELLRLIRLGVPEVELIGDARTRLEEFNAN